MPMQVLALMPFDQSFDDVYARIEDACSAVPGNKEGEIEELACTRVDKQPASFEIVPSIKDQIRSSTLCVVDLTDNSPNVLWELGFAMALNRKVVLLTQDRESVGFNIRNLRIIEYRRDDLQKTLEQPLQKEFEELVKLGPDQIIATGDQATALAMSTASPAYFLDASFTIQYMNEAAALLFESPNGAGHGWVGRSLRDFVDTFWRRLKNLPDIEKNLQAQTEEILAAREMGQPSSVTPHNIEKIVLETVNYGIVDLQKTGVAVRDPNTKEITGWVVSFNFVPKSFDGFLERHKNIIEGRLFKPSGSPAGVTSPTVETPDGLSDWISGGMRLSDCRMDLHSGYAKQQRCLMFATQIMKADQSRYGLSTVRALPRWFFDYHNSQYVELTSSGVEGPMGVFRIHMNHDMLPYVNEKQNLDDFAKDLVSRDYRFADVGCYIHPKIQREARRRCLAWLLGYAACRCHNESHEYIYAQVPVQQMRNFQRFLFRPVGKGFQCDGWNGTWFPILIPSWAFESKEKRDDWVANLPKHLAPEEEFFDAACEGYRAAKQGLDEGFI